MPHTPAARMPPMARLPNDPDEYRMSFGDHLEELRRRLIHATVGVLLASMLTFYYGLDIVAWLKAPLMHALRNEGLPARTTADLFEPMMTYMKVSIIAAIVIAAPWVAYQLWQFVAAGLYPGERKVITGLAPFSALMTALAVLFTYYVLLPLTLTFLIHFGTLFPESGLGQKTFIDRFANWAAAWGGTGSIGGEAPSTKLPDPRPTTNPSATFIEVRTSDPMTPAEGQWWINKNDQAVRVQLEGKTRSIELSIPTQNLSMMGLANYIDTVLLMLLSVVIAFHLPVAMWIAGLLGLDPTWLSKFRRHCFFGCMVAAAVLTPSTDPFNMSLLAVPLYLLYEIGLIVMRLSYKKRATPTA